MNPDHMTFGARSEEIAALSMELKIKKARLRHLIMAAQQAGQMRDVGIVCEGLHGNRS